MESTDSSAGSPRQHQPNLPPGFRFHPTDEELVVHYLKKKAVSAPLPVAIIAEVDLYKFDPWELPAKATFGEQEWYFFSPRDRKYPNGARPNRAATSGYWKATGTDKPVLTSGGTQKVGVKKALVFYGGKPPKGVKTNWIMHEYRLADNNRHSNRPPGYHHHDINKKNSLRLDDWVLCRIYKKANASRALDHHHHNHHHLHHHDRHDSVLIGDDVYEGPTYNTNNIPMGSVMSLLGPQNNNVSVINNNNNNSCSASTVMSFGADHHLFEGMLSSNSEYGSASASASVAETEPIGQNAMLGGPEGIFQRPFPLPGMNWYSN